MPLTATQTKERLENTKINPKNKVKGQRKVTIVLNLIDVEFDPKVLYEALDAKYGTVASDKDSMGGRNNYEFRISA